MTKFVDDKWMRDNRFAGVATIDGSVGLLTKGKGKVVTIDHSATVDKVIALMTERGISQIPVTHNGTLIGMVREGDIFQYLASGEIDGSSKVIDVMDRFVPTVEEQTGIGALQEILMYEPCAVVIDQKRVPQHIVTKIDLVDWLCKNPRP
jgi:cystathionine beta-synthase